MDWASLYPAYAVKTATEQENPTNPNASHAGDEKEHNSGKAITKDVEIADIGCGFGGLLFALATRFPDTLSLGTSFPFHLLSATTC